MTISALIETYAEAAARPLLALYAQASDLSDAWRTVLDVGTPRQIAQCERHMIVTSECIREFEADHVWNQARVVQDRIYDRVFD